MPKTNYGSYTLGAPEIELTDDGITVSVETEISTARGVSDLLTNTAIDREDGGSR